ncbi:hypothetical protein [Azospirillum canadense]|uniref:hypothetical protein n=1 Tax=Azospirillum canadense TaxID=403962 RepID=UPI002226BE9B|nr:hypothetical protein [Azospirillum canadense]MCW2240754.1 hypothetical protein [Azospirillum canadense]
MAPTRKRTGLPAAPATASDVHPAAVSVPTPTTEAPSAAVSIPWARATGTFIRLDGRLTGPDADFLRAASRDGDTPMDTVRRLLADHFTLDTAHRALAARESALTADLTRMADSLEAMRDVFIALQKSHDGMVAFLQRLTDVQQGTARDARTIAAEVAVVRGTLIDAISSTSAAQQQALDANALSVSALQKIEDAATYLNGLVDALVQTILTVPLPTAATSLSAEHSAPPIAPPPHPPR